MVFETMVRTQLLSRIDSHDIKIENLSSRMQDLSQLVHSMNEIMRELPNLLEKMMIDFVKHKGKEKNTDKEVNQRTDGHDVEWKPLHVSLSELTKTINLSPVSHSQKETKESDEAPSHVTSGYDDGEKPNDLLWVKFTQENESGYEVENRMAEVEHKSLTKQLDEDNDEQKNPFLSSLLDQQSIHEEDHGGRKDSSPSPSLENQCRHFSLAKIKLATHDFDDAFVIGKGGFGKVYKGILGDGEGIDVAIKRLNLDSSQGAAEFWAEIEMLSKFRHSHIVSLLGYCEESSTQEMILVYEYMPNGSFEDHLHRKRVAGNNSSPLTWMQRLNICIGAARGLDYLHTGTGVQSRVIHRDVKSSNILLDKNFVAKISDFGISRMGPAYQSGSTTHVYTGQVTGTFGYMDAEYFATHRLTRKSDVYAFGVVLLEVLCGRPALDFTLEEEKHSLAGWAKQCIKEGNMGRIIDPCLRGQVSANCLKKFGQIAYQCLHSCSKERPTMTEVLAKLEFVLAKTLRSTVQSSNNQTHIGRSVIIDKAWSLFLTKPPRHVISDSTKGIVVGKHVTTVAEGVCDSSGVATAPQLVVTFSEQKMIPILKRFTYSDLQKATRNFKHNTIVGGEPQGSYGRVFKGWLDGVTYAPMKVVGAGIAVAIKKLGPDSLQGLEEWQAEINFLGKFSHPNLVKLLGYCQEDNKLLLVYEFLPKGSLNEHLFRPCVETLPWYTRIKIAIGIAQGLAFLHSTENNVIYRDVKCSSFLLDDDFNVKITDFGLARTGPLDGESHVTTRVKGTNSSYYAAPEYITTGHLYVKSDVYGFGVVMLEILTGLRVRDWRRPAEKKNLVHWAKPFLINRKRIKRIMDPRLEHNYPLAGASKAGELILTCLEKEPKNRPSMEKVVLCLHGILAINNKTEQVKG